MTQRTEKKRTNHPTKVGEFTIDPRTPAFQELRSVCDPGNPWRCLIATAGSIHLGKRMTVRLDHEERSGVLGVTVGEMRYERPMTSEEVAFATKFDLGANMRKPLTVRIDLADGTWRSKGKKLGGGADKRDPRRPRAGDRKVKSIRARQLAAIKKAHANRGDNHERTLS